MLPVGADALTRRCIHCVLKNSKDRKPNHSKDRNDRRDAYRHRYKKCRNKGCGNLVRVRRDTYGYCMLCAQKRRDWLRAGAPRVGWKRGELIEMLMARTPSERAAEWGDVGYYIAQTWSPLWWLYALVTPQEIIKRAVEKMERRAQGDKGKMELKIKETGEIKTLTLVDPESGVNWISDFIGVNSGFGDVDKGLIDQDPDSDHLRLATQKTYDWWAEMIMSYEGMEEQIANAREKYGRDEIDEYLQSVHAFDVDLEDTPGSVALALEDYVRETETT